MAMITMQALAYAHARGIIHRDVKQHNVIVDNLNQVVRLIDWGISDFYFPGLLLHQARPLLQLASLTHASPLWQVLR
jgi:serine/threonine protein kinase